MIKTTFEHWLKHIFIYSQDKGPDPEGVLTYDYEAKPEIEVGYIEQLFGNPVEHLSAYTDEQINRLLWYLTGEIEHYMYELFNDQIPLNLRIQVVKNIHIVYEQLFAPRCSDVLGHSLTMDSKDKGNPLNSICYMWWDISPLYGKSGEPNREMLDPYCLDVMESTLSLPSIACQEGALHGLGHWEHAYPERVQQIIDSYLERETEINEGLRDYALAARTGMVL